MAMKLRRSRSRSRRMFHKKSVWPRVLGWILLVAVCAGAGIGVVHWSDNASANNSTTAPSGVTGTTGASTAAPTTGTTTPPAPTVEKMAFLSLASLRDAAARPAMLQELRQNGYTAVLFDLKDENGALHYAFTGELAKKAKATADTALTKEELDALVKDCRTAQLEPVARLFAFKDKTATAKLKSGRINWSGDKVTLWLDAAASKGGKSWLNPYAEEAQSYITELATELTTLGFDTLVLDGVQFPEKTFEAYFGTKDQTAESYLEVLSRFVKTLNTKLADTRLLLAADWEAVAGVNTAVYGGNPLSFGADGVCPMLAADSAKTATQVKTEWEQMVTRLEFFEGQKPTMMPWLPAALATALPKDAPKVLPHS
ncbi:MAG: hypothetical protein IJW89_05870 [Clostridia bacterium]|nr:hypothetical protein [Clostridia bacterium]